MAAIIYCWQQQQHVRGRIAQLSDISSGATCVADLDSGALALTKEASRNSRVIRLLVYNNPKTVKVIKPSRTLLSVQSSTKNHLLDPR